MYGGTKAHRRQEQQLEEARVWGNEADRVDKALENDAS